MKNYLYILFLFPMPMFAQNVGESATTNKTYFQFVDTEYTESSPVAFTADIWSQLPNNSLTIIQNAGNAEAAYYTSNEITPSLIDETYIIRIDFKAKSSTINNYLTIALDIGDGTPIQIFAKDLLFARGLNTEQPFSETYFFYCKNTFLTNGGKVMIKGNASFEAYDIAYTIKKI